LGVAGYKTRVDSSISIALFFPLLEIRAWHRWSLELLVWYESGLRKALRPVTSVASALGSLYNGMNPSTLTGAIDVIVVRQPNGDLVSSPFHVRFGKFKLLAPQDKIVELQVNGTIVDLNMKVCISYQGRRSWRSLFCRGNGWKSTLGVCNITNSASCGH
jgi:hypothetical protein